MHNAALAEQIAEEWSDQLAGAVRHARSGGLDGPALTERNLAWAIAWLVLCEVPPQRSIQDHAAPPAQLDSLRIAMSERSRSAVADTWLERLAQSIACEHRTDWHHPETQASPDVVMYARTNGDRLMEAHQQRAIRMTGDSRAEGEEIAAAGVSAIFNSYWSPNAKRRWAARSAFTTLIIQIGGRAWRREQGRQQPTINETILPDIRNAPMSAEERREFAAAYIGCRDKLPARQRLALTCRLERGMRPFRIAECMGVTRSRVTELLNTALPVLAECLRGKGYGTEGSR